jgi:hypothetical protein
MSKEIFTRMGTPVKDAALIALKAARPRWHLIDAKSQVSVMTCDHASCTSRRPRCPPDARGRVCVKVVGRLATQIAMLIR